MELELDECGRLLRSCDTRKGIQLHLLLLKRGLLQSTVQIANCLLQMYLRSGYLKDAQHLFDEMPDKNCFSWNSLIEAYLKAGKKQESISVFNSMPHKNDFSWNAIISGLAKSGDVENATCFFNQMPIKTHIVWNSMIHVYARTGQHQQAFKLFQTLNLDPYHQHSQNDCFILATMLRLCANLTALVSGKQIHTRLVTSQQVDKDPILLSSLINMYAKCGDMHNATSVLNSLDKPDEFSLSVLISGHAKCGRLIDARKIFDNSKQSLVLWNSIISGYIANNDVTEALYLFNRMHYNRVQADFSTFTSILSGCASSGVLKNGIQVHAYAYKLGFLSDMHVASVLIDMYSKCASPDDACRFFGELEEHDTVLLNSMINLYSMYRRIEDARYVFEMIPTRSLISWNSMIVGYSQNGCAVEAIYLFCDMHRLNVRMDEVSLASAISASASICYLRFGEQIFSRATTVGLETDHIIATSLIDFFCKCGNISDGRKLFNKIMKFDQVPWNSMLTGYSTNGCGNEALDLFDDMRHAGVSPNDITFTAVLSACNHSGLVDKGRRWFHSMKLVHHIEPGIEHYSCMIDMCARAGFLEEAMDLINQMPFKADACMWYSVLRGCRAYGYHDLGEKVAEHIIELDPESSSAYVQLAGIHANSGDWERSAEVRKTMQGSRIRKNPGCSWTELDQMTPSC